MSEGRRTTLLAYLTRLGRAAAAEGDDAALLERFSAQRDEAAFAALLRRHGPLVWGVCRRVLAEEHAAEDAFQATFLVLVRKARSVSKQASLRSWLYGVALRVAVRARRQEGLRRQRERVSPPRQPAEPSAEAAWQDVRPVLDEEIQRLPEKYRLPVVLCYLEGQTNDEAARQLHCPRGTIATRLARAREKLRSGLARRGVTLSAGGLAAMLSEDAVSAALAPTLIPQTMKCVPGGSVSVVATKLAEGVLHAMFVSKIRTTLIVVLVLSMIGGAGVGTYYLYGQVKDVDIVPIKFPEKQRPDKIAPAKTAEQLRKLLTDRRDKAEQEAKARHEKYRQGAQGTTLELAIESAKRLRKAELELSIDKTDRIAAHERYLKLMKEYEEVVGAKYKVGRVALEQFALAEYERLDAEVELEREKTRK